MGQKSREGGGRQSIYNKGGTKHNDPGLTQVFFPSETPWMPVEPE